MIRCHQLIHIRPIKPGFHQTLLQDMPVTIRQSVIMQPTISELPLLYIRLLLSKVTILLVSLVVLIFLISTKETPNVLRQV